MQDFPKMTVGILEIPAVATPESLPRRHRDVRSRLLGPRHHLINFGFAGHIVTYAEFGGTARCRGDSRSIVQTPTPEPSKITLLILKGKSQQKIF